MSDPGGQGASLPCPGTREDKEVPVRTCGNLALRRIQVLEIPLRFSHRESMRASNHDVAARSTAGRIINADLGSVESVDRSVPAAEFARRLPKVVADKTAPEPVGCSVWF
jgi:hypothetical protein